MGIKTVLLGLCLTTLSVQAQNLSNQQVQQLLQKNRAQLNGVDWGQTIVSDAYHNQFAGTDMVYLQQAYLGIPVYNEILTIAFKNETLKNWSGQFIESIDKKINAKLGQPVTTAIGAIQKVIAEKKLIGATSIMPLNMQGRKTNYGKCGTAQEDITSELVWLPVENGKELKLAWQIFITPNQSSDYWLIHVDAKNNTILKETNLTITCNWDDPHPAKKNILVSNSSLVSPAANNPSAPALFNTNNIASASYRVVPYPAESPNHPGGTPSIVSNPWNMAGGNATSLGWHSDGTNDYSITRGNNVWAKEDRAGNNGNSGLPATSTTTPDLNFDFTPDFTVTPTQTTPVQNQQFNITNLFYWNNIFHDMSYNYGFDEVAGNFQVNNQGRGGAGNDYVKADAQDGGGTNNANFSTPADGGSGRMQMYLWNGSPQIDGDADNGVMAHEFTHGTSNRLTGGPSQAGCLGNAEQMGEGWSDYFGLMVTQNWAITALNDGYDKPRGVGTYAVRQPINGPGIRQYRYTTNMSVNPLTYANLPSVAAPHGVGTIWCTILWDMTWNIIQQTGTINPNLFDANAAGGNSIALKLVLEGMKLQPCSPGFVDGRDAILAADQLLYNGAYRCAIVRAFARRGVGFDAKQGSSDSRNDQVVGFSTIESKLQITQNIAQQEEGLDVTYTNTVSNGACGDIVNYQLVDTIPANATWVSGGTYDAANRTVKFTVNQLASTIQQYAFTVKINTGTYFPTTNLFEDVVPNSTLSPQWGTSGTVGTAWVSSNIRSYSAPYSYYAQNRDVTSDQRLYTEASIALGASPPNLSFWHWFNTEGSYDGGVLEISSNNGSTWSDIGFNNFLKGGYTGTMDASTLLPGRKAWTGNSGGFIKTIVNMVPYANQVVKLRFRFTSDDGTKLDGWFVDDIALKRQAEVDINSQLFNTTGTLLNQSDTFTLILPPVATCVAASITSQSTVEPVCNGGSVQLHVAVAGSAPVYQWQQSTTGCAGTFADIAGATSSTLPLNAVTMAQNNYAYRLKITNNCTTELISNCMGVQVTQGVDFVYQPNDTSVCAGSNVVFNAAASSTVMYQWQKNTNGSWIDISGATNATYEINAADATLNNSGYRVHITGNCTDLFSNTATLHVTPPPSVTIIASPSAEISPVNHPLLTAQVTPAGTYFYQWFKDGNLVNGATQSTYQTTLQDIGNFTVTVSTNATGGCSNISNILPLKAEESKTIFMYPNPTAGIFWVSYYKDPATAAELRTITIYDAKGSRVLVKTSSYSTAYQPMQIDLSNHATGIYMVELKTASGKRLASAKILIR